MCECVPAVVGGCGCGSGMREGVCVVSVGEGGMAVFMWVCVWVLIEA